MDMVIYMKISFLQPTYSHSSDTISSIKAYVKKLNNIMHFEEDCFVKQILKSTSDIVFSRTINIWSFLFGPVFSRLGNTTLYEIAGHRILFRTIRCLHVRRQVGDGFLQELRKHCSNHNLSAFTIQSFSRLS